MKYIWPDDAFCANKLDVMFPEPGEHRGSYGRKDPYTAARKICARCPVFAQCKEDALDLTKKRRRYGMQAGMNPSEIRRTRDAMRVAAKLEEVA